MSEWKKVKLGELCDFINGGAWSDKEYVEEGIPVLKVTNCKNSGFSLSDLSFLPYSLEQKYIQNKLQIHDVIIATVGSHPNLVNSSAGRSVIANSFVEGFYLNQNAVCVRTKNENILNQLYWGYYSKYYLFQNYIQMRGKGAANQMRIAISAIKDYPMPLPPISYQKRIATILSRYDSLIENYQKQIKLLEEAAQRLYKEWFVDLRFPGHESTNIIDGVPEGWDEKPIMEVFDFRYGKILPTADFVEDGPIPVYGASKQIGRYIKANCFEPKVLVGSRGNAGFVHRTIENESYVTNNSFMVTPLDNYVHLKMPFIFESFKIMDFVAICTGAAQPQLTLSSISSLKYNIPSRDLITQYCDIAIYYFRIIAMIYKQIRLLTEARDRLLPKLMSGDNSISSNY